MPRLERLAIGAVHRGGATIGINRDDLCACPHRRPCPAGQRDELVAECAHPTHGHVPAPRPVAHDVVQEAAVLPQQWIAGGGERPNQSIGHDRAPNQV